MNDRMVIPIFDPGDLSNATGRCEVCEKELRRRSIAFAPCEEHPDARAIVISPASGIKTGIAGINLQPLNFMEAEENAVEAQGHPNFESILKFCCGTHSAKPEKIVKRYRELHDGIRLQAIPQVDFLDKKIVKPLLQAQTSYMTANFIATIAMCGIVAEMLSNFTWEIYQPSLQLGRKPLTESMQKALFGRTVDDMTQEARLNVLEALDLVSPESVVKFKRVKDVRNQYIHFHKSNPEEKTQKQEAAELFRLVQELVCDVIGQDFSNGRFNINQATFAYLEKNGLIKPFPTLPPSLSESEGNS